MMDLNKLPINTSILLDDNFRKRFMEDAIRKAGSLRALGRIMGYTGNAPNWSVKQILYGKQSIPSFRLERLCRFMNVPFSDIEKKIKQVKMRLRCPI